MARLTQVQEMIKQVKEATAKSKGPFPHAVLGFDTDIGKIVVAVRPSNTSGQIRRQGEGVRITFYLNDQVISKARLQELLDSK